MRRRRRVHTSRIEATLLAFVSSLPQIGQRHHARRLARRMLLDPILAVDLGIRLHVRLLLRRQHLHGLLLELALCFLFSLERRLVLRYGCDAKDRRNEKCEC